MSAATAAAPARLSTGATVFVAGTALVWLAWMIATTSAALERGWPSDMLRQWIVGQYIQHGKNPYRIGSEVLVHNLGPRGLTRDIPQRAPEHLVDDILPYGPPEATAPPPASASMAVTLHRLPPGPATVVWLCVNFLALSAIIYQLARLAASETPMAVRVAALMWLAMGVTPISHSIAAGQVALPVFACLLYACTPGVPRWLGGVAMAFALFKPSIALPFLILPMKHRRASVVGIALGIQGALLLALSAWLGVDPFTLTRQWLDVSRHFVVSFFGIQDVLFRLGWIGTPQGSAATLLALLIVMLVGWWGRGGANLERLAFVSLGSLLWTYHLGYDFVCQLPAWLMLLGWDREITLACPRSRVRLAAVILLIAISNLAYFPPLAWDAEPWASVTPWLRVVVRCVHLLLLTWLIGRLAHSTSATPNSPRSLMHPAQPCR